MTAQQSLWWRHARWPIITFLIAAPLLETTGFDRALAHAWYFDAARGEWRGAHDFWADTILHIAGGRAVRCLGALVLMLWVGSGFVSALRPYARPAAFVFVSMALSIGLVGLLKQLTNIDCPWDLHEFGGRFPLISLLGDRPDEMRPAHCFPAAHASSGFALVAFYFVLRERHAGSALSALWASMLVGLSFGIAQQARGAHFLSHDVWSAFLVWITTLSIYVFAFDATLLARTGDEAAERTLPCPQPCRTAGAAFARPSTAANAWPRRRKADP